MKLLLKEEGFDKKKFRGLVSNADRIVLSPDIIKEFNEPDTQEERFDKPNGLWYGFGTSWLDWTEREMEDWAEKYNHVYKLYLNENKVFKIKSDLELKNFTTKYKDHKYSFSAIDWKRFKTEYSGIEINPYLWNSRRSSDTTWYYTWDVASGCIWKKDAFIKIVKIM